MIPPLCGEWGHIPANVTGPMDAEMLLQTLGCHLGDWCVDHSNWRHFAVPHNWQVVVKDRFQYINDDYCNTRARLADCDPPELSALRFHSIRVMRETYQGQGILTGIAVTAFGDVVCRTHRLVGRDMGKDAQIVWHHTAQLLRTLAPDMHDHFAYWN
ncbi:MAG TPA: hypothetical protein VM581_01660 [Magnetospirillaceae bacterium]|nr:hypothetical protein [Magnetospirillaceae bacterium]